MDHRIESAKVVGLTQHTLKPASNFGSSMEIVGGDLPYRNGASHDSWEQQRFGRLYQSSPVDNADQWISTSTISRR